MTEGNLQGEAPILSYRHASHEEYAAFLRAYTTQAQAKYFQQLLRYRERFVQAYPDLREWLTAPLAQRVGRLYGETNHQPSYPVSYKARPYLVFLVLRGCVSLDWDWLLAVGQMRSWGMLAHMGTDLGIPTLIEEAVRLGYDRVTASHAFHWGMLRLFLHTGNPQAERITYAQIVEAVDAIYQFSERPDLALFHGSTQRYRREMRLYTATFHMLHVVLYHRGQVHVEPRITQPRSSRPVIKSQMEAVVERYLSLRRVNSRPSTVHHFDQSTRRFIAWLAQTYPHIETFADVTRDILLEYAEALSTMTNSYTGRPLTIYTIRCELSNLAVFFQDTARWEWEHVPGRPLLQVGDLPKLPYRIPRYIPNDELAPLMRAIRELECPYQRAALLIARWSGARRDEIRRLTIDCLDRYPDGTSRLRIPAGKTRCERVIPLNDEAAEAIKELQAHRRREQGAYKERGFRDSLTGTVTRYLFVQRGKHLSSTWLFEAALRTACTKAGLVTGDGKPTISAHRFRHTVGTQLAEKGARLHTIMKVLGHTSAGMSMVYAQISDPEVRNDYLRVLGPGATIAGPAASALQAGELSAAALAWLKTNYLKTELELGRCLRLPQEGPCECDLYLSCAKFVTTPEYAPRLRRRRKIELELIEDAIAHGWQREVERHQCTVRRIEQLLTDLREPIDGPEATG